LSEVVDVISEVGSLKALVLAGGEGKEMRPLSEGQPKTLVKLLGKPIIGYVLDAISSIGIEDVVIVVNDVELFRRNLSEYEGSLDIKIIKQKEAEVEGAIISASRFIDEDEVFLLAYGDIIAPKESYETLMNAYIDRGGDGAVLITPQIEISTYGVPVLDEEYHIKAVIEKPKEAQEIEYAIAGVYVLPGNFISILEETSSMTEALNMISRTSRIVAALWSGWWVDAGYPWDLITAAEYLLKGLNKTTISRSAQISSKAVIEGSVIIDEGAIVDHNAVIKGPVYIGKNTFIGTGAIVRNYSSIEEDCIVGAYAEISRSVIQPKTSIGRLCFVGDSIIGTSSVIEPCVTISNVLPSGVEVSRLQAVKVGGKLIPKLGAIIGNYSRVRALTLIPPGTIIRSGEVYSSNGG